MYNNIVKNISQIIKSIIFLLNMFFIFGSEIMLYRLSGNYSKFIDRLTTRLASINILYVKIFQAFASNNKFDRTTRLDVGYDDIKNSRLFQPTFKKYLYAYTRSNFLRIDADEAAISIMLPVQQFKKGRPY